MLDKIKAFLMFRAFTIVINQLCISVMEGLVEIIAVMPKRNIRMAIKIMDIPRNGSKQFFLFSSIKRSFGTNAKKNVAIKNTKYKMRFVFVFFNKIGSRKSYVKAIGIAIPKMSTMFLLDFAFCLLV